MEYHKNMIEIAPCWGKVLLVGVPVAFLGAIGLLLYRPVLAVYFNPQPFLAGIFAGLFWLTVGGIFVFFIWGLSAFLRSGTGMQIVGGIMQLPGITWEVVKKMGKLFASLFRVAKFVGGILWSAATIQRK